MNDTPERTPEKRLANPPRQVPSLVFLRLIINRLSFGVVWSLGVGTIILFGGVIVLSNDQIDAPVLLGPGLVFLAILIILAVLAVLYFRVRPILSALSHGQLKPGRITHMYDQSSEEYKSYENILEEFADFTKTSLGSGVIGSIISRRFNNWPMKIMLEGATDEIDVHLDMGTRMMQVVDDPKTGFLITDNPGKPSIVMVDQFPWLNISPTGEWIHGKPQQAGELSLTHSLLRSFMLVLITYALSAFGLALNVTPLFNPGINGDIPVLVGIVVASLFTLSHAVVPAFFYRIFFSVLDAIKESKEKVNSGGLLFFSGFIYLHIGFWYGIPILGLAALTGWLNLAWVAIDVLRAGRGRRHWAFLQHGSTSIALVLFLTLFSGTNLFPMGIVVVLFQALLLTVLELKAKKLWIKN